MRHGVGGEVCGEGKDKGEWSELRAGVGDWVRAREEKEGKEVD